MRKVSAIAMCLVVLAAILAACGGNSNNSSNSGNTAAPADNTATNAAGNTATNTGDTGASNEKVTISIYYPKPDQTELRAIEDDKIKRFEEKYPNVTVTKSDWQYDPNEVGIKMAANEAPTFFNTYATEAKFLVEKGWAADITDLWNNYQYKDEINPVLQNQFIIDGKVYGVAQTGYVVETVVNKKLLDAKGITAPGYDWTWDDMLNTAKAAADPKKGIAGIAPMGKGNEAGWNWTNFLFEAGGEIQSVADGKVTATFNSDAGVKALDFYNKLRWEANAIPQDWALGWGDAVGAFAQGRTAMVMAGASDIIDQALNQGGMKPEDLLVYPMPAAEAGGKHTGVLGGNYLVINPNATAAEKEAAFNYITFDYFTDAGLTSLEDNIKKFKTDGKYYVPQHMNYYNSDSEYGQKAAALFAKYDNVFTYNEESTKLLDGKPEAQYNTQDYYATVSNVVQEVFSKKGGNSKAQLDAAAKTVQDKFFNSIKVQ